jgi:heparinase II/III-like protein
MIADVGEIGPDHLRRHAHADTLSFELSLRGQRVLVNAGTSTYEVTADRLRQRGTAAHNTVVVDGIEFLRGLEQPPGGAPGAAARGDLGPGWRCTLAVGRTRGL